MSTKVVDVDPKIFISVINKYLRMDAPSERCCRSLDEDSRTKEYLCYSLIPHQAEEDGEKLKIKIEK